MSGTESATSGLSSISGYTHPEVLVETSWVAEHLNDPHIRLIEADEDVLLYEVGHLPGAVKLDWHVDVQDPLTRDFVNQQGFEELHAPPLLDVAVEEEAEGAQLDGLEAVQGEQVQEDGHRRELVDGRVNQRPNFARHEQAIWIKPAGNQSGDYRHQFNTDGAIDGGAAHYQRPDGDLLDEHRVRSESGFGG